MHARIRKKALIFLLRHGGMLGRELRNECGEETAIYGIIDLAICCCTLTPSLLLIDSSIIPLICMLFPVSKQIACLRLSAHCRLVWDIVLQLSVWYCNNGQVINPENPEKCGANFSKQARKKTKKGKRLNPRNIIDRANYLKLSFHRYVLKFPWHESGYYFDWEYSPGSTKPIVFFENFGFYLETGVHFTDCQVCLPCTAKSRHENCSHVKHTPCTPCRPCKLRSFFKIWKLSSFYLIFLSWH